MTHLQGEVCPHVHVSQSLFVLLQLHFQSPCQLTIAGDDEDAAPRAGGILLIKASRSYLQQYVGVCKQIWSRWRRGHNKTSMGKLDLHLELNKQRPGALYCIHTTYFSIRHCVSRSLCRIPLFQQGSLKKLNASMIKLKTLPENNVP